MLTARHIETSKKCLNLVRGQVILVDICNTLADINSILDDELGKRPRGQYFHPSLVGKPDYFSQNLWIFEKAKPFKGSVEALNRLARYNRILYVTARPESAEWITKKWLYGHGYPRGILMMESDKVKACKKHYATVAIEDAPENIEALRQSGIEVFVVRNDYNEDFSNVITW